MEVLVAGGHGQIALRLLKLLSERGHRGRGLIRNPDHAADLRAVGAEPVLCDLESASAPEIAEAVRGADAAVFAAGAGPGSGAVRKDTVDRGAAVLLAQACELAGVRRYVMVSSMGADTGAAGLPDGADEVFAAYLDAKKAADDDLRTRDLDWTILRPGALTMASGSGHVRLAEKTGRGEVPREDVAAVLLALLDEPRTAGLTLELIGGDTPIPEAVAAVLPG